MNKRGRGHQWTYSGDCFNAIQLLCQNTTLVTVSTTLELEDFEYGLREETLLCPPLSFKTLSPSFRCAELFFADWAPNLNKEGIEGIASTEATVKSARSKKNPDFILLEFNFTS